MLTLVCHPLEMANKINDADQILITLRFSSLLKFNTREVTITLGFQCAIERAASPVREIICPWEVDWLPSSNTCLVKHAYLYISCQSEEPKNIYVGIFEYILASMLKVFLDM